MSEEMKERRWWFHRIEMGIVGSQSPSATWPVALGAARKKRTGHFGRDDMFSFFAWQDAANEELHRTKTVRWRTVPHSADSVRNDG